MGVVNWLFGSKYDRHGNPLESERKRTKIVTIKAGALDSASGGDDAAYWAYATNASADEIASAEARQVLRARCRYEYLNDPFAQNAARNLAIAVVGIGPRLQIHSDRDGATAIERGFQKWSKAVRLVHKLHLAVRALVYDGEAFFRFVQDDRIPGGFNMELIDAGRITSPTFGGYDRDENVLDGIRFDRYGNPVSYTVARHVVNPIYSGIPIEFETVPADEIIHLFIADLPGQHRGLPLMQSSLKSLSSLRRYNMAVIEAAETAACYAAMLESQALPLNESPDELAAMDEFTVPRRGAVVLPKGWKAYQMKAEQPTAQHGEFVKATLTGIGAGVGQPRNIISNDSSDYNYSSGRLDHQTFFRYVELIQQLLEYPLDTIFDRYIEETGQNADRNNIDVEWYFAELAHVDPLKEADAAIKLNDAGLLTKQEYFAKFGQDWEAQLAQWNAERQRMQSASTKKISAENDSPRTEAPVESVQDTALNGAQVTAAVDIVVKVATGELSPESAIHMLADFFQLSETDARAMVEPATKQSPQLSANDIAGDSDTPSFNASGMKGETIISVDFDGTIVENAFPKIGEPRANVFNVLRRFKDEGVKLILWTCREGDSLQEAVDFCAENGVVFDAVNRSLSDDGELHRKPYSHFVVDDRNLGGIPDDWESIYKLIKSKR